MSSNLHTFTLEHGWTELADKLANMDTTQLFAELDDTIQLDLLKVSNDDWAIMRSQKIVYTSICRELLKRIGE